MFACPGYDIFKSYLYEPHSWKIVPNIRTTKSEPFKMTSKQTTKDIVSGKGNPIRPKNTPVSTNMPKNIRVGRSEILFISCQLFVR